MSSSLGLSANGFGKPGLPNTAYLLPTPSFGVLVQTYRYGRVRWDLSPVLIVNLLVYLTFFRGDKINWVFLILTLLLIVGPMVVSYFSEGQLISRMDMNTLYSDKIGPSGENYIRQGEVIYKVAAGLSILIFLAALLKNKMRV